MTFSFTAAAGSPDAISLPKEIGESLTATVGSNVKLIPTTTYGTKQVKRYKNGNIIETWVVNVITQEGERSLFIGSVGAKEAFGRAMLKAGIDGWYTGDTFTVTATGEENVERGRKKLYEVVINHNPANQEVPVINQLENNASASTEQQISAAYAQPAPQAPQAPQAPVAPPVPQQPVYQQAPVPQVPQAPAAGVYQQAMPPQA